MKDNVMSSTDGRKAGRREALWFLLSGAGLLAGCTIQSGYKPTLPESCVWAKFPYTWLCIDPEEGDAVPEQETKLWEPIPLSKSFGQELNKTVPLSWESLFGSRPDVSFGITPALYKWYSVNSFSCTDPTEVEFEDVEPMIEKFPEEPY
jgi:hypothetical protein